MNQSVVNEGRDAAARLYSFVVHGQPGSAPPTLVSVAARQLSTGGRAAGASPVFVGLGVVGLILAAVCVTDLRPRWRAVAVVLAALPLVVLAEIMAVVFEAPDAFAFLPVPLFVIATHAMRAHSVSGDIAALCLAAAVLSFHVAVLDGQKENPAIVVALVFSFVFLAITAVLTVAANVVCHLAQALPRALSK